MSLCKYCLRRLSYHRRSFTTRANSPPPEGRAILVSGVPSKYGTVNNFGGSSFLSECGNAAQYLICRVGSPISRPRCKTINSPLRPKPCSGVWIGPAVLGVVTLALLGFRRFGVARCAPVTHRDQGLHAAARWRRRAAPGTCGAPENRRCRAASRSDDHRSHGFPFGANPSMARGAGAAITTAAHAGGHDCVGTAAQSDLVVASQPQARARRPAVHPKQRSESNGPLSRITWKHARASLCATALIATGRPALAALRW